MLAMTVHRVHPEDPVCCLIADEISLKTFVDYYSSMDKVVGVENKEGASLSPFSLDAP